MTQTEMFPKTELDEATAVLSHLMAEQEKADKAVGSAQDKAYGAMERVRKQRHVVRLLQSQMPATEPIVEADATEEPVEDAEVLAIDGEVVDPETGEVRSTKEPLPTPDTMTMVEMAEEFGALIELDENADIDGLGPEQSARYEELAEEFKRRDRDPSDWQKILREGVTMETLSEPAPAAFDTFAERSQPAEPDDDIWTKDDDQGAAA